MLRQLSGLFPFNQLENAPLITSEARAGRDVNIVVNWLVRTQTFTLTLPMVEDLQAQIEP